MLNENKMKTVNSLHSESIYIHQLCAGPCSGTWGFAVDRVDILSLVVVDRQ